MKANTPASHREEAERQGVRFLFEMVLNAPAQASAKELEWAEAALGRMSARKDEDPKEWARKLAEQFATFND